MRKKTTAPNSVRKFLRKIAAKGGKSTAAKLTSEQRSEAARKAVNARWAKYRAAKESGSEA